MKKIFLFAAIAALFAACSSKDEVVKDDSTQQPQLEKGAIGFDVYTQKATTRAGWTGSLTTDELKKTHAASDEVYSKANGFGVFGYYTDNNEYEQRSVPNFMYNQQVTWSDALSIWQYEPIMYWPNEYGKSAESDDQDKVTFFAYAPYVEVIPTSGKLANTSTDPDNPDNTKELETYGITGMTRNSNQGDPILKYIASFNTSKSVDLCWGVQPAMQWNTTQTGSDKYLEAGMPWLNVQRPAEAATQQAANQRVKFIFKHATAQMRVKIDADVDVDGRGHDNKVDGKTRVWVRQVTFKGFAMRGSLNLNNDTPDKEKWLDYNGQNEIVAEDVTVYDGRKDGKEGVNGAIATNEKVTGLNPALIQAGLYVGYGWANPDDPKNTIYNAPNIKLDPNDAPGVTNTPVNLFESKDGDFFHVIPVDNEAFEVEIVYDIETIDASLAQNLSDGATKGSSIENRISKTISFGNEVFLKAGHSYTLNLHLGMYSVKFDAAVTDWITEPTQDVDLPLNVPAFAASTTSSGSGSSASPYAVEIPYKDNYEFAISGLQGGESLTATVGDMTTTTAGATETTGAGTLTGWSVSNNNSNASGYAIQTLTTAPNPTTVDRTQKWSWKGNQSSFDTYFAFTQKAHPLFMKITKFENSAGQGVITLTRYDNTDQKMSDDWKDPYGWLCDSKGKDISEETTLPNDNNYIKVYRNGIELKWLKYSESFSSQKNEFKFRNEGNADKITNTITIGDELKAGDVIKVVLKTGDAPEEIVSHSITAGVISFESSNVNVNVGETVSNPLSNNGDGTVTYLSTLTSVATVNDEGVVSLAGPGITKIKATVTDGSDTWYAIHEVSYTLVVTPSYAAESTSGTLTTQNINVIPEGGTGTIKITGLDSGYAMWSSNDAGITLSYPSKSGSDLIVTYTITSTASTRSPKFRVWSGQGKGVEVSLTQTAP